MTRPYHHVVVRDRNSWSPTTGRGTVLRTCPHRHRTELAAVACLERYLSMRSRDWFDAHVETWGGPSWSDYIAGDRETTAAARRQYAQDIWESRR